MDVTAFRGTSFSFQVAEKITENETFNAQAMGRDQKAVGPALLDQFPGSHGHKIPGKVRLGLGQFGHHLEKSIEVFQTGTDPELHKFSCNLNDKNFSSPFGLNFQQLHLKQE